jgi:hypothetical protein
MEHNPKISFIESIFLIMYVGITDIIGIILVLFGLDDFFILDVLTFPVTQLYFRMKGVRGMYDLIGNLLELIPYIGALPLRTIGVIMVIWRDHHPKSKITKINQISQKIKNPSQKSMRQAA